MPACEPDVFVCLSATLLHDCFPCRREGSPSCISVEISNAAAKPRLSLSRRVPLGHIPTYGGTPAIIALEDLTSARYPYMPQVAAGTPMDSGRDCG